MQINAIETFILKVSDDEPYLGFLTRPEGAATGYVVRAPWRSLYSDRYETVYVKLTAEDGSSGWGEALAPVAPEVVALIIELLLAPTLVGMDADSPAEVFDALRQLMRERGHLVGFQADALAAVDIALWDLAARRAGTSVAASMSAAHRAFVPTYVSGLPKQTDAERVELAELWTARGASAVKLHLGAGIDADLATVRAIRAACPDLRVAVDAHWAYTVDEAIALAAGLADAGAWFLEAPTEPEDVEGHARIRAAAALPIAIGESLRNRFEFRHWIERGAVDIVQPDIARTGITEGRIIADLAAQAGLEVAPHHSVGLSVSLAAGVHFSAALPNLLVFEYQPTSARVGDRFLQHPLPRSADGMAVPTGPGLGIDVDESGVRGSAVAA